MTKDYTGYADVQPQEFSALLYQAAAGQDVKLIEAVDALILYRTLERLRKSSRDEILQESLNLNEFLTSGEGKTFQSNYSEKHARWSALADLISQAARRSDAAAAHSILSSHPTYGKKLLEILAANHQPVPRVSLVRDLEISESQLSHLLRDLEEADIVVRFKQGREVMVDLGTVGTEIVERSIMPRWVEAAVNRLKSPQASPSSAEEIAKELIDLGAPSAIAAKILAEALAVPSKPLLKLVAGMNFVNDVTESDPHARQAYTNSGRPAKAFAADAA
jgi:hypothetical protein